MAELPPSPYFPPIEMADPDGLLGIGGQLTPDWLLDAYRRGIFPWPITGGAEMLAWWSLDPRAILPLDGFHLPRRLRATLRSGPFSVTCNRDFHGVITGCATAGGRVGHTWLTPEMIAAYQRLHELGHAHSVEAWHAGRLAGGIYGVAIGGSFSGESMFHRVRDASKVALAHLVAHLRARGFTLMDIQQLTPHTEQFGAIEIPRDEFLARLSEALSLPVTFGAELESPGRF
jgi:leucyl/phenylalanyl-tRNA--protein transferase